LPYYYFSYFTGRARQAFGRVVGASFYQGFLPKSD
jgi:hypothetical protein